MDEDLAEQPDRGVLALERGYYCEVVRLLNRRLGAGQQEDWRQRQHLAMAYYLADCLLQAQAEFQAIEQFCPQKELRQQARQAVLLLNLQILRRE